MAWLAIALVFAGPPPKASAAEGQPWLAVGVVRVMEPWPDVPATVAQVPVVLGHPAPSDVTFTWAVRTATADTNDVRPATGTGRIAAGQQVTFIPAAVIGDSTWEDAEERASVKIANLVGATARDATGSVRIRDARFDPAPDGVVMGDVYVAEPDAGSVTLRVPVLLPKTRRSDVTASWRLKSQYGAKTGEDVAAATGSTTIAGGTTSATMPVTVYGDTKPEPSETVLIEGLDATGARDIIIRDMWGSVVLHRSDAGSNPVPWTAPASVRDGPVTTVYFESDLGDWVGQGRLLHDTLATSGISVAESAWSFSMRVDGDHDTTVTISLAKDGRPLREGKWFNLPWTSADGPSADVSHNSATCGRGRTNLVVPRVDRAADGTLKRFVLRLEQFCEGDDAPLRLFARYSTTDTTMPPPPGDPNDFTWRPPAGGVPSSGSYLYLQSSPGDWVGQGQTYLLPIDETVQQTAKPGSMRLWFPETPGYWDFIAGVPGWVGQWERGLYPVGYGGLANPVKAALDVSGYSRGCNEVAGELAVDDRSFDVVGQLTSLRLRFKQICDGQPPMYGQLRWIRP